MSIRLLMGFGPIIAVCLTNPASAQDAKTYGEALSTPVFERIDQNGVDLLTGTLRVTSPTLEVGPEAARQKFGLVWAGRSWLHVDRPTIWRKDGVYTVTYKGISEEFNDRGKNYSQRKPITGASLSCNIWEPGNLASECIYTSRHADTIHFFGFYSNLTPYPPAQGQSAYAYGNLGMTAVEVYSEDEGYRRWGTPRCINCFGESGYNQRQFSIVPGGAIKIETPNHDNDSDEHYLRPRNTTQTITDPQGGLWRYTFNDDRRMTLIDPPGDAANISITYNDGKVQTVTNADGTWTYSYTTPGDYGTTTVINPLGEQTYVKYHRDRGYVTEHRDALYRTTYYYYDSGYRLERVVFPEQNYLQFTYDARGNILTSTEGGKPGGSVIVKSASYETGCANRKTCNRPIYVEDGKGNRTNFEYGPVSTGQRVGYHPSITWPIWTGESRPIKITAPAALGGLRPETRNVYAGGLLTQTSTCRTTASCAGTSDEVVTNYIYDSNRYLASMSVTSNGQTLRTCYTYNANGHRSSESPPRANLSGCPTAIASSTTFSSPVTPHPMSPPTYPGTGGQPPSTPTPIPPPNNDPPPQNCGPGTGQICQ